LEQYKRLPHWQKPGATYFVTWRLYGSLAKNQIAKTWTADETAQTGPQWLKEPAIAQTVIEILLEGATRELYELGAWVLMPNHVHILIRPKGDLAKRIAATKSISAKRLNRNPFWAKDYFDRLVFDRYEEQSVTTYILNNPIKAGLVNWPFSSTTTTSKDQHQ
jgi:putative transposase